MPATPRLDDALDEVLGLDAGVLEHLAGSPGRGLRVPVPSTPPCESTIALHRVERELRDVLAVVGVHLARSSRARRRCRTRRGATRRAARSSVRSRSSGQVAWRRMLWKAASARPSTTMFMPISDLHAVVGRERLVDHLLQPRRDRVDDRELARRSARTPRRGAPRPWSASRRRAWPRSRGTAWVSAAAVISAPCSPCRNCESSCAVACAVKRLALRLRQPLEERHAVEHEAVLADDRLRRIDLDRPVELLSRRPTGSASPSSRGCGASRCRSRSRTARRPPSASCRCRASASRASGETGCVAMAWGSSWVRAWARRAPSGTRDSSRSAPGRSPRRSGGRASGRGSRR